jgi:hypothetical protein
VICLGGAGEREGGAPGLRAGGGSTASLKIRAGFSLPCPNYHKGTRITESKERTMNGLLSVKRAGTATGGVDTGGAILKS